jgi:hypothetical protein
MIDNPWRVPAYLPYLQPPLTPEAIADVERSLGVKLPDAYLACLAVQNGGYVRLAFPDRDIPHRMIWGIGPHFPHLGDYCEALDPENREDDLWVPAHSERLVPFDGDGHWHLCLDYRDGSDPAVCFVDTEAERERRVADSFAAYLRSLAADDDTTQLGIRSVASLDEVAQRLEPFMQAAFDPANAADSGYPVRRCRLPSGNGASWVWLSPNRVARGFVRPTDPRYAELKDALPGQALRLPEHPDVVVTVGCTPDVEAALAGWCASAGLDVVVLGAGSRR